MLKRNETLSKPYRKNINKRKRLVLRLEASVKNIFCLYFSPIPELWSRKKVIFEVFVFWRCSETLNEIICNNKQRRNKDKCRCECKELIDKRVCDKGFIWNPSNCECECDKSCNISQYLDYSDCKCKKKLKNVLKMMIKQK